MMLRCLRSFQRTMLLLVWLLCGSLAGPVPPQPAEPAFHRLPVFLHAPGPLVSPELFRPDPRRSALPPGLSALLVPASQQQQQSSGHAAARAVEVWCGMDSVTVRVDRSRLRAWSAPNLFRLGACAASRVTPRHVVFHYSLLECGGDVRALGGQLVYTFVMRYVPPPQDRVLRVLPLHLPVHCHYNRFHYSYQVGFRPQIQQTTFQKRLRSKLSFSLTVCDAQWEPLSPGHTFLLGEPMYFLARAGVLLEGERLYVDWCYATASEDPSSSSRVDIISNNGCMMDSRREGSSSRFLAGGGAVLKFSVDAFLFREVSQVQFLHCSLSLGLEATEAAKSCNFNQEADRWEELQASSSVCSCCDSLCGDHQTGFSVKSFQWSVHQKEDEKLDLDFPAKQDLESGTRTKEEESLGRRDLNVEGGGAKPANQPPHTVMSDESRSQINRTALDLVPAPRTLNSSNPAPWSKQIQCDEEPVKDLDEESDQNLVCNVDQPGLGLLHLNQSDPVRGHSAVVVTMNSAEPKQDQSLAEPGLDQDLTQRLVFSRLENQPEPVAMVTERRINS